MSLKYDEAIRPVLSSLEPKTVKATIKTVEDELKISNLNVAKTYYNYTTKKVDVEVLKKAIGYNDYLVSVLGQLQDHLEFLNNSENVIMDTVDIQNLKEELGIK